MTRASLSATGVDGHDALVLEGDLLRGACVTEFELPHRVAPAVPEPCTNRPNDLNDAVRRCQSARLAPGLEFVTRARVRLGGLGEAA